MTRPKAERRAVGTLLLRQREASKALRASFRESADPGRKKRDEKKVIVPALAATIYEERQLARSSARRRLSAELSNLGIPIEGHQWVVGNRRALDQRSADRAADSLAKQWTSVARAAELEEDTPRARLMKARLERTAQTEVARAYSEEHREALRDVVEHDRRFRDGSLADEIEGAVRRRWSALADACERCRPLDGEEIGLFDSFSGGYEPGDVHPRCLCVDYLVRI